jgi:hypothetical protein
MYGGMPHFQSDPYSVCGYPWHPFKLLLQDSPRMVGHDTPIVSLFSSCGSSKSILGKKARSDEENRSITLIALDYIYIIYCIYNWKHTMATYGNSK